MMYLLDTDNETVYST